MAKRKIKIPDAWLELERALKHRVMPMPDQKRRRRPKKKKKPDPEAIRLRKKAEETRVKKALSKKPKYKKLEGDTEELLAWGNRSVVLVSCPYCKAPKGYLCISVGPNHPREKSHKVRAEKAEGEIIVFAKKAKHSRCAIYGCKRQPVYNLTENENVHTTLCRKHTAQMHEAMSKIILGII